jgi:hypothetical protein
MNRIHWILLAFLLCLGIAFFFVRTIFLPKSSALPQTSELPSSFGNKKRSKKPQPFRVSEIKSEEREIDPRLQAAYSGIRGRLLWKDHRKPRAGIPVRALVWDAEKPLASWGKGPETFPAPFQTRGRTKTDGEGRFLLSNLDPTQGYLLVFGKKFEGKVLRTVDQRLKPGEILDIGEVLALRRGTLRGVLRDQENQPISGARLIALDLPASMLDLGLGHWDPKGFLAQTSPSPGFIQALPLFMEDLLSQSPFAQTSSGQDGSFILREVPSGEIHLFILHKGHRSLVRRLKIQAREQHDFGSILLEKGMILEGSLLDGEGRPMKKVELAIAPKTGSGFSFARQSLFSDREGKFCFRALGEGRHFLFVHLPGENPTEMPWTLHGPFRATDPKNPRSIRIFLKRGLTLSVQVKSQKGRLLPHAKVRCSPFSLYRSTYNPLLSTLLDKIPIRSGTKPPRSSTPTRLVQRPKKALWSFMGYPPGRYQITVIHPSFAPYQRVLLLNPKTSSKPFQVTLFPSSETHLLVKNRAEEPVSSAEVFFHDPDQKETFRLGKTDKRGRLHLKNLPKKPIILLARHPAYALGRTKEVIPSPQAPLLITLPQPGRIEGVLTVSGKPYSGPPLRIRADPESRLANLLLIKELNAISREGGRFVFPNLSPGEYTLLPFAAGIGRNSPWQLAQLKMEPRKHRLSNSLLTVKEGKTCKVRWNLYSTRDYFRDRKGKISGKVMARGAKGMKLFLRLNAGSFVLTRSPDSNGEFSFEHLPQGDHQLTLFGQTSSELKPLLFQYVRLKPGGHKKILFELSFGTMEGILLDPKGKPLDHQSFSLTKRDSSRAYVEAVTNAKGRFHLKLPSGQWFILLTQRGQEKLGYSLPDSVFRIKPKGTTQVRLKSRLPKSIQGTVLLDLSLVHPDWRKNLKKILPEHIVFQGRFSEAFWSVPLAKAGQPTRVPLQKRTLCKYRIYAPSPHGFWTTLFELTEKNRLNFQAILPPPKELTLPPNK